jgi:hypothetical protein
VIPVALKEWGENAFDNPSSLSRRLSILAASIRVDGRLPSFRVLPTAIGNRGAVGRFLRPDISNYRCRFQLKRRLVADDYFRSLRHRYFDSSRCSPHGGRCFFNRCSDRWRLLQRDDLRADVCPLLRLKSGVDCESGLHVRIRPDKRRLIADTL